jgi:hypothetical protein
MMIDAGQGSLMEGEQPLVNQNIEKKKENR